MAAVANRGARDALCAARPTPGSETQARARRTMTPTTGLTPRSILRSQHASFELTPPAPPGLLTIGPAPSPAPIPTDRASQAVISAPGYCRSKPPTMSRSHRSRDHHTDGARASPALGVARGPTGAVDVNRRVLEVDSAAAEDAAAEAGDGGALVAAAATAARARALERVQMARERARECAAVEAAERAASARPRMNLSYFVAQQAETKRARKLVDERAVQAALAAEAAAAEAARELEREQQRAAERARERERERDRMRVAMEARRKCMLRTADAVNAHAARMQRGSAVQAQRQAERGIESSRMPTS